MRNYYESPSADIEKFTVSESIVTYSTGIGDGNEGTTVEGGGDDEEF